MRQLWTNHIPNKPHYVINNQNVQLLTIATLKTETDYRYMTHDFSVTL